MKDSKHTPIDYSEASHVDEVMEELINENGAMALEPLVSHAIDKKMPYFTKNVQGSILNNLYYKPR